MVDFVTLSTVSLSSVLFISIIEAYFRSKLKNMISRITKMINVSFIDHKIRQL